MGWDFIPRTANGRTRTAKQVLHEELVPSALAVYVNLKAGTAYAALPGEDGQIYARYYIADTEEFDGETHYGFKHAPVEESPRRWPHDVAKHITHWY
ncbi:hypothetical protein [uncultured Microbacterium sp.]|uniref:hypothetical protein n=1 Tax=uncultured Microbacterium sp. TaxID=191216 RepID=UPI002617262C|nr:hypothetical protein [uncultured Microbacterium sp.]